MIFISHRGNISGPSPETENSPAQIEKCIEMGFDVEVDLRTKHGKLYLGHDYGQYEVTEQWLYDKSPYLWIHCKDMTALDFCVYDNQFNFFFHDKDQYTVTSGGYIWANIGQLPTTNHTIIVMPEKVNWFKSAIDCMHPHGICSDIIINYRNDHYA
jgi:glycerophosphoryl diester phosphodiesterase